MNYATIPSRMYIDVTNQCPLHCLHCCTCAGERAADEMTTREIYNCIHQGAQMGICHVVFSGGEPMLREDLAELICYARSFNLHVTLLTSGVLMGDKEAAFFASHQVRVKMSVDGVTEETHDYLRGKGAYQLVNKALTHCVSAEVSQLAIHYTVHRYNVRELTGLAEFMRILGVRDAVVSMIKPAGRASVNDALLIPPEMTPYVRQLIVQLEQEDGIRIQRFSEKGWDGFGCAATCNKIGVTANGYLTTCAFFGSEMHIGNIRQVSLQELWSTYQLHAMKLFRSNTQCHACDRLAISGGGCRARALHYHNDINAPDPYCCAEKERLKHIEEQISLLRDAFSIPFLGC